MPLVVSTEMNWLCNTLTDIVLRLRTAIGYHSVYLVEDLSSGNHRRIDAMHGNLQRIKFAWIGDWDDLTQYPVLRKPPWYNYAWDMK